MLLVAASTRSRHQALRVQGAFGPTSHAYMSPEELGEGPFLKFPFCDG